MSPAAPQLPAGKQKLTTPPVVTSHVNDPECSITSADFLSWKANAKPGRLPRRLEGANAFVQVIENNEMILETLELQQKIQRLANVDTLVDSGKSTLVTIEPSGSQSIPPTPPRSSPERLISEWSPSPNRSQKRSPSSSSSQDMDLPIPESSYVDLPLQNNTTGPNNTRPVLLRKVLPPVPPLRREGTGQILVPNSDISMSQSQSQEKSQPQRLEQCDRQLVSDGISPPTQPKPLPSQEEMYDGDASSPEGGRLQPSKRLKVDHESKEQAEARGKKAHPLEITPPGSPRQELIREDGPELEGEAKRAQSSSVATRPPRRRLKPLSEYYAKNVDHGLLRRSKAEAIKRQIRR